MFMFMFVFVFVFMNMLIPVSIYITSPRNILVVVEVLNVVPKTIPVSSLVQPDISWLLVVAYCRQTSLNYDSSMVCQTWYSLDRMNDAGVVGDEKVKSLSSRVGWVTICVSPLSASTYLNWICWSG